MHIRRIALIFCIAAMGTILMVPIAIIFRLHSNLYCGNCEIIWIGDDGKSVSLRDVTVLQESNIHHSIPLPVPLVVIPRTPGIIVLCCNSFTNEIIFEAAYATTHYVTALLTNASYVPSYLDFSESLIMFANYAEGEWHLSSVSRMRGPYSLFRVRTGGSVPIHIAANDDDEHSFFSLWALSQGGEFPPGRYRVIAITALSQHKGEGMTHEQWLSMRLEGERRATAGGYTDEEIKKYLLAEHPTYPAATHVVWAEFVVE